MAYESIVEELRQLIDTRKGWKQVFERAVCNAQKAGVPEMDDILSVEDYLRYINELVRWIPGENSEGREVLDRICKFYFILGQPSLLELQTRIEPADVQRVLRAARQAWLPSRRRRIRPAGHRESRGLHVRRAVGDPP